MKSSSWKKTSTNSNQTFGQLIKIGQKSVPSGVNPKLKVSLSMIQWTKMTSSKALIFEVKIPIS